MSELVSNSSPDIDSGKVLSKKEILKKVADLHIATPMFEKTLGIDAKQSKLARFVIREEEMKKFLDVDVSNFKAWSFSTPHVFFYVFTKKNCTLMGILDDPYVKVVIKEFKVHKFQAGELRKLENFYGMKMKIVTEKIEPTNPNKRLVGIYFGEILMLKMETFLSNDYVRYQLLTTFAEQLKAAQANALATVDKERGIIGAAIFSDIKSAVKDAFAKKAYDTIPRLKFVPLKDMVKVYADGYGELSLPLKTSEGVIKTPVLLKTEIGDIIHNMGPSNYRIADSVKRTKDFRYEGPRQKRGNVAMIRKQAIVNGLENDILKVIGTDAELEDGGVVINKILYSIGSFKNQSISITGVDRSDREEVRKNLQRFWPFKEIVGKAFCNCYIKTKILEETKELAVCVMIYFGDRDDPNRSSNPAVRAAFKYKEPLRIVDYIQDYLLRFWIECSDEELDRNKKEVMDSVELVLQLYRRKSQRRESEAKRRANGPTPKKDGKEPRRSKEGKRDRRRQRRQDQAEQRQFESEVRRDDSSRKEELRDLEYQKEDADADLDSISRRIKRIKDDMIRGDRRAGGRQEADKGGKMKYADKQAASKQRARKW